MILKEPLFIKKKIEETHVSIIGVAHTETYFEEYRSFFEKIIKEHNAIILEQPVGLDFWESPFFDSIGKIVHSLQKTIYQVDPTTSLSTFVDDASAVGGLVLIGGGLYGTGKMIYQNKKKNPKKQKISRRNFLKKMGYITGGSSLFLGSIPGIILKAAVTDVDSVIDYGVDDVLTYGETDYRNIKIAEGIERICHEVNNLESLASIHGAAHCKTVEAYLDNPVLRKKILAYLPYEVLGEPKIREYKPHGKKWVLVRKF